MVKIGTIELGDFPIILAPMEDITDYPFRSICKNFGVDLMFTEFVSSEGLIRNVQQSVKKINTNDIEKPIGVQIFGDNVESMRKAALIAEEHLPNLIDINFGCPAKNVALKGSGAGMLLNLGKMQNIAKTIVNSVKLPVTAKTRLGWDESSIKIIEIALRLQDAGVQALSIHARTRSQSYKIAANWEYIAEVINDQRIKIPIFGNGDIDSAKKAIEYKNKYGVDGIMIGRAAIGNPWIFSNIKSIKKNGKENIISKEQKIETILKHIDLSIKYKGEKRGIIEMRKHYSSYMKTLSLPKYIKHVLLTSEKKDEIMSNIQNSLIFNDEEPSEFMLDK